MATLFLNNIKEENCDFDFVTYKSNYYWIYWLIKEAGDKLWEKKKL